MTTCPHCKTELHDEATVCRGCGAVTRKISALAKLKDIALVVLAAALVLAAVLFAAFIPRAGIGLLDFVWLCGPVTFLGLAGCCGIAPLARLRQNYYGQTVWTRR